MEETPDVVEFELPPRGLSGHAGRFGHDPMDNTGYDFEALWKGKVSVDDVLDPPPSALDPQHNRLAAACVHRVCLDTDHPLLTESHGFPEYWGVLPEQGYMFSPDGDYILVRKKGDFHFVLLKNHQFEAHFGHESRGIFWEMLDKAGYREYFAYEDTICARAGNKSDGAVEWILDQGGNRQTIAA